MTKKVHEQGSAVCSVKAKCQKAGEPGDSIGKQVLPASGELHEVVKGRTMVIIGLTLSIHALRRNFTMT